MRTKRLIAIALLLLLPLGLACAQHAEEKTAESPENKAAAATAEATLPPATAVPAAEQVTLTMPPTPVPTEAPTPVPTPVPTPSPVPTDTPTPSPTPAPTATPEPQVAFVDTFQLVNAGKKFAVTVNNKSLPDGTAAEIRLEDGTVVGSGKLRKGKSSINVTLPEDSPVRTGLYLYTDGQDWPHHFRYIAVTEPNYSSVEGNYQREDKMVALTFDCAFGEQNTDWLLDTLRSYGIHVTFFMTGRWAGNHGPWIEKMLADGHELGNHTMHHKRMATLSNEKVVSEITEVSQILYRNHGYITHLMRPPYGGRNVRVNSITRYLGYEVIMWGQTSKDAHEDWTGEMSKRLVLKEVQPGDIILFHNGANTMHVYLKPIIEELISRGWTFGTVSELMGWDWTDVPPPLGAMD